MTADAAGLRPETVAVGHGHDPADWHGAVKPPIALSSTFAYPSAAAAKAAHEAFFDGAPDAAAYIYARLDHPNLRQVEARLRALDGAAATAAFASGMAAISATFLAHLRPGDALLHTAPLYGGTHGLIHGLMAEMGVRAVAIADALDPASIAQAAAAAAAAGPLRLVMIETPANPTAGLADIAAIAAAAAQAGGAARPVVAVDNTFLGPLNQRPLAHGADLTITSLTKYAGGHSDVLGGAVSGSVAAVAPVRRLRTSLGAHLDPFSCWLMLRSLETLPLRSARACANAEAVARFLGGHPKVAGVTWLGMLPDDGAARAVYARQCAAPGSTFSFRIRGGEAEAFAMLDRLRVLRMAVSLGGTETLICHSATTTHHAVPEATRRALGVDAASLRISVGIEHPDDLIADLAQALEAV
jgi:cystathionine gamma-synthase/methionine-gamma-lyase